MKWSISTSCLYIEGLNKLMQPFPHPSEPDILVFAVPLGAGKCPLIYLQDYALYVRWMFDTPSRSNGLYLSVATEDISWADLASAFTSVTGKKAIYIDVSLDQYFSFPIFPNPEAKVTNEGGNLDDPTLLTIRENFSGFGNSWKDNLSKRDYGLLDEILPTRVKSVKEWMALTGCDRTSGQALKHSVGYMG